MVKSQRKTREGWQNFKRIVTLTVEGEECACRRTHRCCKTLVIFYFRWWGHRHYFLFLFKLNIHIIYPLLYAYFLKKVEENKRQLEVK